MPRSDLAASVARAVGTGLALVLPVAALAVLRQFAPLALDPDGPTGWLAPITLGVVAIPAAAAVVPLLAWLVTAGRLAAGAAGLSATALTAGTASLALAGPSAAATLPNSGLAIGLVVVAGGLAVAAWAGDRALATERERWLGVIVALVVAETALAAALLAPGSSLDEMAATVFAAAAVVAAGAAAGWAWRRHWDGALATTSVALAAALLAVARPGTVDAVLGLAPLIVTPALLVMAFVDRAGEAEGFVARLLPRLVAGTSAPGSALAAGAQPGRVASADETVEKDRLTRELRAALAELTDARHTIALQRAELERAAEVDALTGVASRSAIMERLREEVAAARRYPHPVSIVLLDVDGMGILNAIHGTGVGDAVLRELALRMRVRVREADAIGRVAGDAFLAVLPHTDERGATVFAEAIRDRATQRPISTGQGEVTVTVSIGVTTMRPHQDLSADALLARADEAVASARRGGGNVIAYDRLHGLARLDERRRPGPSDTSGGAGEDQGEVDGA